MIEESSLCMYQLQNQAVRDFEHHTVRYPRAGLKGFFNVKGEEKVTEQLSIDGQTAETVGTEKAKKKCPDDDGNEVALSAAENLKLLQLLRLRLNALN